MKKNNHQVDGNLHIPSTKIMYCTMTTRPRIKKTVEMFSVDFNHYKKVMRKEPFKRNEPVIQYSFGEFIARIDAYEASFTFMFISGIRILFVNYSENFDELYNELVDFIKTNRLRIVTGGKVKWK